MTSNPSSHGLLWLALALYATSLVFAVWRLALGQPYRRWPKLALVLPGFLIHTYFLWVRGLSDGRCPVSNLFETLTFVSWCLVALHLLVTALRPMNYLTVFYIPLVLAVQLAALVAPSDRPQFEQWREVSWLGFHASVITLGYAAFGLAGSVALMYLIQERQLRTRRLSPSFMLLPPMLRLESLQGRLIAVGFALLTLGLLSGIFGLRQTASSGMPLDIKWLWSIIVWGMYLALLAARFVWKMNGRWMAWFSVTGFVFVLSTFWLSNAWSQFHRY